MGNKKQSVNDKEKKENGSQARTTEGGLHSF